MRAGVCAAATRIAMKYARGTHRPHHPNTHVPTRRARAHRSQSRHCTRSPPSSMGDAVSATRGTGASSAPLAAAQSAHVHPLVRVHAPPPPRAGARRGAAAGSGSSKPTGGRDVGAGAGARRVGTGTAGARIALASPPPPPPGPPPPAPGPPPPPPGPRGGAERDAAPRVGAATARASSRAASSPSSPPPARPALAYVHGAHAPPPAPPRRPRRGSCARVSPRSTPPTMRRLLPRDFIFCFRSTSCCAHTHVPSPKHTQLCIRQCTTSCRAGATVRSPT